MASASPQLVPSFALPLAGLDQLSGAAGESRAVLERRRSAAALLAGMELPSRSRHLWRYTDPARFVPAAEPVGEAAGPVSDARHDEARHSATAIIAGGAVRALELSAEARRAGLVVADLHRAVPVDLLGGAVADDHGFIEALNAAAWRGGVLVHVPAGVRLEQPVRVRCVAPTAGTALPRILVIAERDSELEILEGHVGGGAGALSLSVAEVLVGEGARVRYDLIQRWDDGVVGHHTARARVAARARFQLAIASFGGSVFKADVGAILAGEHAEAETYGVAMGGGAQHFDHHTEHLHHAPDTRSNLDFKVALTDRSRSAYTGMIRIAPDAARCEAYQENRNLLLSEDARAESIPELEILNEDVRCSHGATVAPLEEEQLFYLGSRGLPHTQAMRLIVYGFLDQTLARLPEASRARLEALVAARLHAD